MDTVKYIFCKPDYVEGVGLVYPVQLSDYDLFMTTANTICLSRDHFDIDETQDVKLLDIVLTMILQSTEGYLGIYNLTKAFSIVLKKKVVFNRTLMKFTIEDDKEYEINRDNYDKLREIIMQQNLLFVPKVYKNKRLQAWVDKAIKARAKGAISSTIEDKISTVSALGGKDYSQIEQWSIYQLNMEFNRLIKIESYRTAVQSMMAGAKDVKPEHFVEMIDLFMNPYDDILKDKNKLNNLNSAIKGG